MLFNQAFISVTLRAVVWLAVMMCMAAFHATESWVAVGRRSWSSRPGQSDETSDVVAFLKSCTERNRRPVGAESNRQLLSAKIFSENKLTKKLKWLIYTRSWKMTFSVVVAGRFWRDTCEVVVMAGVALWLVRWNQIGRSCISWFCSGFCCVFCRVARQCTAGTVRVATRTSTTAIHSRPRFDLSMFSERSRSMRGAPLSKWQIP